MNMYGLSAATIISGTSQSGDSGGPYNEIWLSRLLDLAKQYSYEINIMIDVKQGEYRPQ